MPFVLNTLANQLKGLSLRIEVRNVNTAPTIQEALQVTTAQLRQVTTALANLQFNKLVELFVCGSFDRDVLGALAGAGWIQQLKSLQLHDMNGYGDYGDCGKWDVLVGANLSSLELFKLVLAYPSVRVVSVIEARSQGTEQVRNIRGVLAPAGWYSKCKSSFVVVIV